MRAFRYAGAALAVALCLTAGSADAAPLIATFGGPVGFGTNSLPPNDDSYSSAIPLTPAFPSGLNFFGTVQNTAYVNTNGNITFAGGLGTYTPSGFPVASRPMIAPYWGDVDIRGPGYPNENGVFWVLQPGRMVVTWHNVGHYSYEDGEKMDFQLIITTPLDCGVGDFDVEFRYNRCEWEAGGASGDSNDDGQCQASESSCTPAQVGFDAGDSTNYVSIPGSLMHGIDRVVCDTSNVGEPGVWRFSVRGGTISCPGTGDPCDTGEAGACGVGITQCVMDGVECVGIGSAAGERCDGIDNDCNGTVDDGATCTAPLVCLSGSCREPCFEGGCLAGEACNADGACVEIACEDVTCAPGTRCLGGECVGACDGVTCPHEQRCLAGRCIDACDILTCGSGEICQEGRCVPGCPCTPCGDDAVCGSDGECTPLGCDIVICEEGFYCSGGECLDACAGATCPAGQYCERGMCIDGIDPDPGGTDAGPGGGSGTDAGPGGGTGADGSLAGIDAGTGRREPPAGGAQCACRAGSQGSPMGWAWAAALVGLAFVRRIRRR